LYRPSLLENTAQYRMPPSVILLEEQVGAGCIMESPMKTGLKAFGIAMLFWLLSHSVKSQTSPKGEYFLSSRSKLRECPTGTKKLGRAYNNKGAQSRVLQMTRVPGVKFISLISRTVERYKFHTPKCEASHSGSRSPRMSTWVGAVDR
jgi:hypothetical protein